MKQNCFDKALRVPFPFAVNQFVFSAAGDRVRPILWSPDVKRPKTEPSLSSKKDHDLSLPVLVAEPEKFKVRVYPEM